MRSSRLLTILLHLQSQGRVSAQALARSLEVSVRTIYRDIDALSAAGVPVYAETGRHGGFALRDGYRTQLTGLDQPEAEALFVAGGPLAAAQLGLGPALESTRLKLLAALPAATGAQARQVAARCHVDPVAWFQAPDTLQHLPGLAAAVWRQHVLHLHYDSWKGEVQRRVAPLGLVLKGGLWYLVGAVDGQPRTYRVASILALSVTDEPAPPLPGFDLQRHWAAFVADYEARMQTFAATVRARPAALARLAREQAALAPAVAAAPAPDAQGWQTAVLPLESLAAAVRQLLPLAPDVQATAPPALCAALREAAAVLAGVYGRPGPATKP